MDSEYVKVTEDDITCKLCFKFFSTPILVDCLHTYCHQCVKDNTTTEGSECIFRCPQCKHESPLKDESGDSLITDRHANRLQDIYAYHSISDSNCVVCSLNGETSEATQICLDCDDCLCGNCATGHNSSTATASHRVVCLDDLKQGHYDKEIMNRQRIFCSNHKNETCNIFCHTCSQPTCIPCVLVFHKDHCYEGIEDAAEKKRFTLSQTLKASAVKNSISPDILLSAQSDLDKLDKEEKEFVRNVTETAILFIEKIKKESQAVLEKGRQGFQDERRRRERRKEVAEMDAPKRENIVEICTRVAENDNLDVVVLERALHSGLNLLPEQQDIEDNQLKTFRPRFAYSLEKTLISCDKITLPKPSKGPETNLPDQNQVVDSNGSESTEINTDGMSSKKARRRRKKSKPGTQQSDIESANDQQVHTSSSINDPVTIFRFRLSWSFSAKIGTDKSEPDICFMTSRTPETCLIMDKCNAKLKIFKLTGDMLYLVNLSGKCTHFEQCVHAGTGDLICAISENNLLILSRHLFVQCKIPLPTMKPNRVPIVANFGESLLVGNLPGNEMRVYDTSGELLRTWKNKVGGTLKSIKYAGDDKVVMTTWKDKGAVHIESEQEGPILKINGQKRNKLTWQPTDAVVDSKGHVIVTDTQRNEISIFTSTGSLLLLVDTTESRVQQPYCMFVDESDNVYVSYKGGKVAVYEMTNE